MEVLLEGHEEEGGHRRTDRAMGGLEDQVGGAEEER